MQKIEPLTHGNYYHIYNKGINGVNLFYSNKNYEHFLHLYEKYIFPIADTYAWCLMPNHFHLLVKIKDEEEIGYYKPLNSDGSNDSVRFKTIKNLSEFEKPDRVFNTTKLVKPIPSNNFSHLFNAHCKTINKQEIRTGSLFQRPFKRIKVDTEYYLRQLVVYIHNNPVKHGFVNFPEQWSFSSYNSILTNKPGLLKREDIISWFDDLDNFMAVHKHSVQIISELKLEE